MGINIEIAPSSLCSFGSLRSSKKSPQDLGFLQVFAGICANLAKKAFVSSVTDVGGEDLVYNQCSRSSHRCLIELRSGLC